MKTSVRVYLNQYEIEIVLKALYRYFEESNEQLDIKYSNNLIRQFKAIYKLFKKG